jgi:hypothetical protein
MAKNIEYYLLSGRTKCLTDVPQHSLGDNTDEVGKRLQIIIFLAQLTIRTRGDPEPATKD